MTDRAASIAERPYMRNASGARRLRMQAEGICTSCLREYNDGSTGESVSDVKRLHGICLEKQPAAQQRRAHRASSVSNASAAPLRHRWPDALRQVTA